MLAWVAVSDAEFAQFMPALVPALRAALSDSGSVCDSAAGALGDVCRAVDAEVAPFVAGIVSDAMAAMVRKGVNGATRARLMAMVGDVAVAVQQDFPHDLVGPVVRAVVEASSVASASAPKVRVLKRFVSVLGVRHKCRGAQSTTLAHGCRVCEDQTRAVNLTPTRVRA